MAVVKFLPDVRRRETYRRLVQPGGPIPPAATAVRGIGDAAAADAPRFAAVAGDLDRVLAGCELAGFGIAGFNLPLLAAEFARTGRRFRVAGRHVVDVPDAYPRNEPRDLASAVRFDLGREHAGAHGALADARAAAVLWTGRWRRTACRGHRPAV